MDEQEQAHDEAFSRYASAYRAWKKGDKDAPAFAEVEALSWRAANAAVAFYATTEECPEYRSAGQ